jgi:protoporphyrinogen IX oxidase
MTASARYHHPIPRGKAMSYLVVKSFHLLFVIAWAAAAFYLPRILINLAEAGEEPAVRARLVLMGKRLYRFGHIMFGIAAVLGVTLWLHFGMHGGWLHAKLTLVALLLAHFIVSGAMVKRAEHHGVTRSTTWLRWFNEAPVFAVLGVIYLVIAKPF